MTLIYILLGCIVVCCLLFALLTNTLYWYETLNTAHNPLPSPKPTIASCLYLYMLATGASFAATVVRPVGWFWGRTIDEVAHKKSKHPPLILVHGLLHNASAWVFLGWILRRAGYAVSLFSYRSYGVSLDTIEERLNAHVRRIESVTGRKPVFVGHSMGGVIVRRWLLQEENRARVAGIVTLGAPHGGSKMAALAAWTIGKHLLPEAPLIAQLASTQRTENIPCISLVSPTDESVLPSTGLLPPAGWHMEVTHTVGHVGMLFCPRIAKLLLKALQAVSGGE